MLAITGTVLILPARPLEGIDGHVAEVFALQVCELVRWLVG